MKALHMVTADPQRTPTFAMFAHPDYFFFAAAANCSLPCITVPTTPPTNTFAWNHGGIQPEIATIWVGLVGPGIENAGTDTTTWADHVDIRPTMLTLLGLGDTYAHDGRAISEVMTGWAKSDGMRGHYEPLSTMYKQLNAPFGQFCTDALIASTAAIKSGSSADDSTYTVVAGKIQTLTSQRDALATQMKTLLDAAAFNGVAMNNPQAQQLIKQAQKLLDQMRALAGGV